MRKADPKSASDQAMKLCEALRKRGVDAILEYQDGHKTVDIAILKAHIYIEVDGLHHFTDPTQIMRDFKRNHFSDGDDFNTFYVTNQIIEKYVEDVADALQKVVENISKNYVSSIYVNSEQPVQSL